MDEEAFIPQMHEKHHLGVDRTFYLAKSGCPQVSRDLVARIVKSCVRCSSIDPSPVQWKHGDLEVQENWVRLAADVTHFNGRCYLSVIDCGPSRFTIWRQLSDESAESVVPHLLQIFRERGPPKQLLMDNGLSFRSASLRDLLRAWRVEPVYRCAYRPAGNGIAERNHRTVKRMAARARADPLDMVFFYNTTPREGTYEYSLPSNSVFRYSWRVPCATMPEEASKDARSHWIEGEEVFVKPPGARCSTPWRVGRVTGVNSEQSIEVNGIPRHVSDIRPVPGGRSEQPSEVQREADVEDRSQRVRRRPRFFGNNIYDV